jgi:hypothetical protein
MLLNDHVLLAPIKEVIMSYITARTNLQEGNLLKIYSQNCIKEFDLVKSKIARDNAFWIVASMVGTNKGIIYKSGFKNQIICICKAFGKENLFHHKGGNV